jgi:hypothetical protein
MAGTITKGNEGIIKLQGGAEVPCLSSWELNTTASEQREVTRCMASNGDDNFSLWESVVAIGRGWRLSLTFYWQKTDEAAAPSFSPERTGETIDIELLPDGASGPSYEGSAIIQSLSKPAEIGVNITQTVNLIGDGDLFFGYEPTVSGSAPVDMANLVNDAISIDASTWFNGVVTSYSSFGLPQGVLLDPNTGMISGSIDADEGSLAVTITATNDLGSVDHNFFWFTWDAYSDAKGWYDTTPSTLKTDLVASFDSANSEYFNHPMDSEFDGAFSISVWVKTSGESWQGIIRAGVSSGPSWYLTLSNSGKPHLRVRDSSQSSTHIATSSITLNAWVHIYAGRDSGGATFLEIDRSASGTPVTNVTGTVGRNDGSRHVGLLGSNYFNGEMAHLAVWNRALTSAEITALYNGGTMQAIPDALKPGGVSYWPLWEPRGVRYDQWGSNHLTDNNTVGAAHGPVELQAGEYAGITKWLNQGLAASPFGEVSLNSSYLTFAPVINNGVPYWDAGAVALGQSSGTIDLPLTIVMVGKADADGGSVAAMFQGQSAGKKLVYINNDTLRTYDYATPAAAATGEDGHTKFVAICEFSDVAVMRVIYNGTEHLGGAIAGEGLLGALIGANSATSVTQAWKGTIEAAQIFDRVLTPQEIAALTALYA